MSPCNIAVFLLIHYGLIAHTFDFHIQGPEEHYLQEEVRKERENREANEVLKDPESTPEERNEARETLDKNGAWA